MNVDGSTNDVEAVEIVDRLMIQFRHKVIPCDHDLVKAYKLGINVQALKLYIEEIELEEQQIESDWPEDCNERGW